MCVLASVAQFDCVKTAECIELLFGVMTWRCKVSCIREGLDLPKAEATGTS